MTWQLALNNLTAIQTDTRPICKRCGMRFTKNPLGTKATYCCESCKDADMLDRKRKRRFSTEAKPLAECGVVQADRRIRASYFHALFKELK